MLGMMRHVAWLERPLHERGPDGSTVLRWLRVRAIYVSLEGGTGTEGEAGGKVEASMTWNMKAYYSTALTPDHRLVMDGPPPRVFEIVGVTPESKPIPIFCTIQAREVVA